MDVVTVALLLEEEEEEECMLLEGFVREDPHMMFKKRQDEGCFRILISRYLMDNERKFREYFRVSIELFQTILTFIDDDISKEACNRVNTPISSTEKLCITLRYMATGESFRSLAFQFRISHSWISKIVKDTLQSIAARMLSLAIPVPEKQTLMAVSSGFLNRWNYPNCVGAVDGKHIRIKCPENSGSMFFNYKDYFSMVLFVLVDDKYKFLAIDVGSYGKEGDACIFPKSSFGRSIADGTFPFPNPAPLPGTNAQLPYVIIGDDAFKLTPRFMRPYPKEQSKVDETKAIYNYRHCRARRVTENAFGILCQYFRVFFTPIAIVPETVDNLVISACILHNLMRNANIPCPKEEAEELPLPIENLIPLTIPTTGRNATRFAYEVRDTFKEYFCSRDGSVDWRLDRVRMAT